jgi:hypothetical protein
LSEGVLSPTFTHATALQGKPRQAVHVDRLVHYATRSRSERPNHNIRHHEDYRDDLVAM